MYLSDFMEAGILKVFNGNPFVAPVKTYLALSSTDPTDSGGMLLEPTYSTYARQIFTATEPSAMSGGWGIQNMTELRFGKSNVNDATATFVVIVDSPTRGSGNIYMWAPLNEPKPITDKIEPVLRVGEAKFWGTGNCSNDFRTKYFNILRGTTMAAITPFASLSNGNPQTGGLELAGANFERKPIPFGEVTTLPTGQSMISNTTSVVFNVATGSYGQYDTDCIFSAASGGYLIAANPGIADVYSIGDAVDCAAGALPFLLN